MIGLVFNITQDVVETTFGPDVWDSVLDEAGVDGAYTMLGAYPDAEFESIVRAASGVIGISQTDVLVMVGRRGYAALFERHADLLDGHRGWQSVLESIDSELHAEAQKIYPVGEMPRLTVERSTHGALSITYRSRRDWCELAEGLVRGLGDWWDVSLDVTHSTCRRHGDERCVLQVSER